MTAALICIVIAAPRFGRLSEQPSPAAAKGHSRFSGLGLTTCATADEGTNPGRTANKAREHLRAVLSWAWEQEVIDTLPRFPTPREQRDVAGRHYLTKAEINALYFATHKMERPRGWDDPISIGRYWRNALVAFFQLRS